MGGTSGVLYDIFFNAAAAALKPHASGPEAKHGLALWAGAFAAGVGAIKRYGGADVGYRTMLDAALPASEALNAALASGASAAAAAAAAAEAAQRGADATCTMTAQAGRSSYVPEAALRDNPDPGAQAVACWLLAVKDRLAPH